MNHMIGKMDKIMKHRIGKMGKLMINMVDEMGKLMNHMSGKTGYILIHKIGNMDMIKNDYITQCSDLQLLCGNLMGLHGKIINGCNSDKEICGKKEVYEHLQFQSMGEYGNH
eukprot:2825216-Heterocapsa_arctica.AAC.1